MKLSTVRLQAAYVVDVEIVQRPGIFQKHGYLTFLESSFAPSQESVNDVGVVYTISSDQRKK